MKIGAANKMLFGPPEIPVADPVKSLNISQSKDISRNYIAFNPIRQVFSQVNNSQLKAEESLKSFSVGETESIHRVIIDVEEALLSLKFAAQVRNKAVEAYQEIMRMQV